MSPGLVGLLVAVAIVVGSLLVLLTPVGGIALLIAAGGATLVLRDVRWSLFALVAVACILPFASLPFSIGFTPTFLDLAFGALYAVWAMRLITRRQDDLRLSAVGLPVVAFVALAVFCFVLGLSHSRPSANDLRTFAEVLMGFGMFFVAVNCVREEGLLRQLTAVIILCGAAEAGIGVALYVLPVSWAVQLLSPLGRLGYPVGAGALRYINDDPGRPMRAIGTNVDPNILGALLVIVVALTATQLVAKRPVLPRWLLGGAVAVMGLCLYLTYSRGSMVGALVAVGTVAMLRYRRLLVVILVVGLLLLLLPQTQAYISHMLQGIRIEDRSTQMRMGEYRDTFRLIARYPWLGVGFVGTPDIDLYVAVASLYLAIAAQMGIVGLVAFLSVIVVYGVTVWRAWRAAKRGSALESLLLGYGSAAVGSLAAGVLDHTLLTYPHAVALLWLVLGLGAAAAALALHSEPQAA
ncbi:MAG: O-antigen ligase family protein [Anaerolineae bacterium]|nr:O-antigen ligase family protein [Anaerolineae bacterium]